MRGGVEEEDVALAFLCAWCGGYAVADYGVFVLLKEDVIDVVLVKDTDFFLHPFGVCGDGEVVPGYVYLLVGPFVKVLGVVGEAYVAGHIGIDGVHHVGLEDVYECGQVEHFPPGRVSAGAVWKVDDLQALLGEGEGADAAHVHHTQEVVAVVLLETVIFLKGAELVGGDAPAAGYLFLEGTVKHIAAGQDYLCGLCGEVAQLDFLGVNLGLGGAQDRQQEKGCQKEVKLFHMNKNTQNNA